MVPIIPKVLPEKPERKKRGGPANSTQERAAKMSESLLRPKEHQSQQMQFNDKFISTGKWWLGAHLQHHFSFVLRNITMQHVSVGRHGIGRCQQVSFLLRLTEDNCSAVCTTVHLQRVDNDGRACSRWTGDSQVLQHSSRLALLTSSTAAQTAMKSRLFCMMQTESLVDKTLPTPLTLQL